jgi:hypothetical protein
LHGPAIGEYGSNFIESVNESEAELAAGVAGCDCFRDGEAL